MPRGVKKENLPSKICATCQRPFTWRKVWENCWDEVKCCSDRCKNERKRKLQLANREQRSPDATTITHVDRVPTSDPEVNSSPVSIAASSRPASPRGPQPVSS
ncbi:hypothetical protein VOLCADRAFT_63265 [Volvox carteri f. nagariensis]|uniref:DUF2256 domain-containing protein n=1 Tax=Volvox carteri f. nagariensis TaxID=3068 RepID=D8U368_VOLCA|nr:uncharacterized protein VOLCADRAFT_63265 [Volvox carteri f. nagariensis]EFJ45701.1 hypothetical protein VOLCADRAFT_63265 [Volvox carteri f. nagariensis]|eukprot:XP_002953102.1 hypothetical protein VOLCADRAFT_63265 [Volvox carteri f. nagariensis]